MQEGAAGAVRARAVELAARLGLAMEELSVADARTGPLGGWLAVYATLQNADVARVHRAFVERHRPRFGSLIAPRVARAMAVTGEEVELAARQLASIRARLEELLDGQTILVLPSACGPAPPLGAPVERLEQETGRSLTLSAIASLGGLPQVSLPLATCEDAPLGVSLVAAAGQDRALLALIQQ